METKQDLEAPPAYDSANNTNFNTAYPVPPGEFSVNGPASNTNFNTAYEVPPGEFSVNGPPHPLAYPPGQNHPQNPHMYQYQQGLVVVTQPTLTTAQIATVPDNMNMAIFATVCCFWPFGIIAVSRATESRNALSRNDVGTAITFAQESRRFSILAIGGGVAMWIFLVIIFIIIFVVV